jgi:hypothetical protein
MVAPLVITAAAGLSKGAEIYGANRSKQRAKKQAKQQLQQRLAEIETTKQAQENEIARMNFEQAQERQQFEDAAAATQGYGSPGYNRLKDILNQKQGYEQQQQALRLKQILQGETGAVLDYNQTKSNADYAYRMGLLKQAVGLAGIAGSALNSTPSTTSTQINPSTGKPFTQLNPVPKIGLS